MPYKTLHSLKCLAIVPGAAVSLQCQYAGAFGAGREGRVLEASCCNKRVLCYTLANCVAMQVSCRYAPMLYFRTLLDDLMSKGKAEREGLAPTKSVPQTSKPAPVSEEVFSPVCLLRTVLTVDSV